MRKYKITEIDSLATLLKNDGVISVPTDTVYGVCARIKSKEAHDNLIKVKNRPFSKLLPIMCADEEQISTIAIIDEKAKVLIRSFMPGPITLILNKIPTLPEYINNGATTVAVRMATSESLKELIIKADSPIFMSSANQSGQPTCTTLDEIEKNCPLLDGIMVGKISFGQGSTIVDCSSEKIKILREGPIKLETIEKVLKDNIK